MKREIKFRAWCRKKQQMRVDFAVNERGWILDLDIRYGRFSSINNTDGKPDLIIMQFQHLVILLRIED